jgi:hypothetical protein
MGVRRGRSRINAGSTLKMGGTIVSQGVAVRVRRERERELPKVVEKWGIPRV